MRDRCLPQCRLSLISGRWEHATGCENLTFTEEEKARIKAQEAIPTKPLAMGECVSFSVDDAAKASNVPLDQVQRVPIIATRPAHPLKREEFGAGCLMIRDGERCLTLWFKEQADFDLVASVVRDTCRLAR